MSSSDYTVIGAGHIHAGKPLAIGDTVSLRPGQAERYPEIFKPIQRATPAKAERPARASRSAQPETPAEAARSIVPPATED